jgi:hypothetical protein
MSQQEKAVRGSYLSVSQQYALNAACKQVAYLFTYGVYQVGSSLTRRDWRDVDLRCIIDDEEFYRMFGHPKGPALLKFLNVCVSDWLSARTGLPIDFQFQQQSAANAEFDGPRNAVGISL